MHTDVILPIGIAIVTATAFAFLAKWLRQPLVLGYMLAGVVIGWSYYRVGGTAVRGNNLVIEQVHLNKDPIPLRMAPMVLIGTVLTHLFGGSAGREFW